MSGLRNPNPGLALYSASKAAVISLMRSAAMEYADKGVRINAVAPGRVVTDMMLASKIMDMKRCCRGPATATHGPARGGGRGGRLARLGCRLVRRRTRAVHRRRLHGALKGVPRHVDPCRTAPATSRSSEVSTSRGRRSSRRRSSRKRPAPLPPTRRPASSPSTCRRRWAAAHAATTPLHAGALCPHAPRRAARLHAWQRAARSGRCLRGRGTLERDGEALVWDEGDMLALPGGVASTWLAEEDAVLLAGDRRAGARLPGRAARESAHARPSRPRTTGPEISPASCARSTSGR